MSLCRFLIELFEHGRVIVGRVDLHSQDDWHDAQNVLTEFEATWRETLPGKPPVFNRDVALQAARSLFQLCRDIAYRSGEPTPSERRPLIHGNSSAADHYSTDIVLRFLPDVWRLCGGTQTDDPLRNAILELAAQWPLSSVGIAGVANIDLEPIATDRCLWTMYVDRILERADRSRLDAPHVRSAVHAAIGWHGELSPKMSAELNELTKLLAST